jgi:hypothetical protein
MKGKKKLTLKQKMQLYKMRNLSWKDRKEIDSVITARELKELADIENEVLDDDEPEQKVIDFTHKQRSDEICCFCGKTVLQDECVYATFMEYKDEDDDFGHPLFNYGFKGDKEQSYNFEFCNEECKDKFREKQNKGGYIVL